MGIAAIKNRFEKFAAKTLSILAIGLVLVVWAVSTVIHLSGSEPQDPKEIRDQWMAECVERMPVDVCREEFTRWVSWSDKRCGN